MPVIGSLWRYDNSSVILFINQKTIKGRCFMVGEFQWPPTLPLHWDDLACWEAQSCHGHKGIYLCGLAVFDDLGAWLVIALFLWARFSHQFIYWSNVKSE